MKSRGTTNAELDATMTRILAGIKSRVDPTYERTFKCSGGCEDTGWVETDDGLDENGKRLRSPVVRRCEKCGGKTPRASREVGRDFS